MVKLRRGMEDMRNAYNILEGKSEWKRKFGRLRCRCKDTVKINFKERRLADMDWIHLTQHRD
jgi:hypothetical protein